MERQFWWVVARYRSLDPPYSLVTHYQSSRLEPIPHVRHRLHVIAEEAELVAEGGDVLVERLFGDGLPLGCHGLGDGPLAKGVVRLAGEEDEDAKFDLSQIKRLAAQRYAIERRRRSALLDLAATAAASRTNSATSAKRSVPASWDPSRPAIPSQYT